MYHSDEVIKQLMDTQYETGRLRTLKYLQMGQDELKTEDVEAASVIVFEAVSAIVDVISFSPQHNLRVPAEVRTGHNADKLSV
jgi:hypothetical protein